MQARPPIWSSLHNLFSIDHYIVLTFMLSSILFGHGQRYIKANVIASAMQHAILETYKLPDEHGALRAIVEY